MSTGRIIHSFSQRMHIFFDTECSLHTGCLQTTQLFLVLRCFSSGLDRHNNCQQSELIHDCYKAHERQQHFLVGPQCVVQAPFPLFLVENDSSSTSDCYNKLQLRAYTAYRQALSENFFAGICLKPWVMFSIDDVACQARNVNHIVEKCKPLS